MIASLCVRFLAVWDGKGGDGQWASGQFSLSHVSTWNSKESKNFQCESVLPSSYDRRMEHILFNSLLAYFISCKYLDIWSVGLCLYSCQGPVNVRGGAGQCPRSPSTPLLQR